MTASPFSSVPPSAHFSHPLRVYWEDTDAGGIVFYANYLKFMERARTEWLASLGLAQEAMRQAGEGMFVVAETRLRYLRPARLDDALRVTVSLIERGRAGLVFDQCVWCADALLVQGHIRIAWVQPSPPAPAAVPPGDPASARANQAFRPGRIPARILAILPQPIPATGAPTP